MEFNLKKEGPSELRCFCPKIAFGRLNDGGSAGAPERKIPDF